MRTSFHHQPEAQHPHSPAIYTPAGRLPHLLSNSVHDSRWQGFQLSPALHRAYRQCSISALQCRLWVKRCGAGKAS